MVKREVTPFNEAPGRPKRGAMTWIGLAAIVLFAVILALTVFRPVVDRHDGTETGASPVNAGVSTQAAE